jgi:hypothetical protein
MPNTANIQKKVLIALKKLPLEKQQEVLDFVELLRAQISPKKRRSRRRLSSDLQEDFTKSKINMNEERKHNARNRIVQAISHLEKKYGELPRSVGKRIELLRITTKELFGITISNGTLKKAENLALWHPKHQLPEPSEETVSPTPDKKSNVTQEASPAPNWH